jgi:hypothetical protein
MGNLLHALLGNASRIEPADATREFGRLLSPGEQIQASYRLIRDVLLFTNARLIMVNIMGITGKRSEYVSVPYRSITMFSVATAGHFDLDAELEIAVASRPNPIKLKFSKHVDVYEVQAVLASHVASVQR